MKEMVAADIGLRLYILVDTFQELIQMVAHTLIWGKEQMGMEYDVFKNKIRTAMLKYK